MKFCERIIYLFSVCKTHLTPCWTKHFSGIKYLNVILKFFFSSKNIILGALLGFSLFLCFYSSNINKPVILCQPPSDCTQSPELHNHLSLTSASIFYYQGLEKVSNYEFSITSTGCWQRCIRTHKVHTKSHSVDIVYRNNHYIVYMPQTQGLVLKFL